MADVADNAISSQEQTEQLLNQIERLKEQNRVLVSEFNANTQHVDALQEENKALSQELMTYLNGFKRSRSDAFQAKDQKLIELHQRCETLQSQTARDKKTIETLMQKNNELKKKDAQYQLLVDTLQKKEISLDEQLRQETYKLHELQLQYNDLDDEFLNQRLSAKTSSYIAEELKSELDDIMMSKELQEDPTKWINSDRIHRKTLRCDAETFHFTDETQTLLENTLSPTILSPKRATHVYKESHTFSPTILSPKRGTQVYESFDGHAHENFEIEDKFSKEKWNLIEKHKLEIVAYKKALIAKNNQLNELEIKMTKENRGRMCALQHVICCQTQ